MIYFVLTVLGVTALYLIFLGLLAVSDRLNALLKAIETAGKWGWK